MQRPLIVLLLLGAVLSMGAESCGGGGAKSGSGSKASPKSCDTRPLQAPKAEVIGGLASIRAKTRSECDDPPNIHYVSLALWFKPSNGKNFVLVTRSDECRSIPRKGQPVDCTVVDYKCKVGTWQLQATATGNFQGKDFAFSMPEKPETPVTKCPKP